MDPGSPFAMVCVPPGCVMAAMSHSVSNKVLYIKKKKKKKKISIISCQISMGKSWLNKFPISGNGQFRGLCVRYIYM